MGCFPSFNFNEKTYSHLMIYKERNNFYLGQIIQYKTENFPKGITCVKGEEIKKDFGFIDKQVLKCFLNKLENCDQIQIKCDGRMKEIKSKEIYVQFFEGDLEEETKVRSFKGIGLSLQELV